MKTNKMLSLIFSAAIAALVFLPGCTPESPPLPPLYSSESSSTENVSGSKTEGSDSQISEASKRTEESAPLESEQEVTVFPEDFSMPESIIYKRDIEGVTSETTITDDNMIKEIVKAIDLIEVIGESSEWVTDDEYILTFCFLDKDNVDMKINGGGLVYDKKRYELSGYDNVQRILDRIFVAENEEGSDTDDDDEWLEKLQMAEDRISELTQSEGFYDKPMDEKKQLTLDLLDKLVEDDLIMRGSIYVNDDMISFRYNCGGDGVLGGIKLGPFDDMMN